MIRVCRVAPIGMADESTELGRFWPGLRGEPAPAWRSARAPGGVKCDTASGSKAWTGIKPGGDLACSIRLGPAASTT